MSNKKNQSEILILHPQGRSRWGDLAPFSPVSRETFRKLVKDGRAPQPLRLGVRCTFYSNAEFLRWLEDPASYRAEGEL